PVFRISGAGLLAYNIIFLLSVLSEYNISLARSSLNKDFRDHAEQQHIAAQQKAALQHAHAHSSGYFITQDSAFGNLILPVLPRLDVE
uniref:SOSS complex subunit C n=1 Tax=Laticauda laticaudata TaxID=8630 RepID=A0A8C5RBW2_LATLA